MHIPRKSFLLLPSLFTRRNTFLALGGVVVFTTALFFVFLFGDAEEPQVVQANHCALPSTTVRESLGESCTLQGAGEAGYCDSITSWRCNIGGSNEDLDFCTVVGSAPTRQWICFYSPTTIDNTSPDLSVDHSPANPTDTQGITVTGAASDPANGTEPASAIKEVRVFIDLNKDGDWGDSGESKVCSWSSTQLNKDRTCDFGIPAQSAGTYTYYATARDWHDNFVTTFPPAGSFTVTTSGPAATSISNFRIDGSSVSVALIKGTPATVEGKLTAGGSAVSGKELILQQLDPIQGWTLANPDWRRTTDSSGNVSADWKPAQTHASRPYRLRWLGDATYAGSTSSQINVTVTGAAGFCGDGVVNGREDCDGGVGGETCTSQGFSGGGSLACHPQGSLFECTFDTSACTGGTFTINPTSGTLSCGSPTTVGTPKTCNPFTVVNGTGADVTISSITSSDPEFTPPATPITVGNGASVPIAVTFEATTQGTHTGVITFTDSFPGSPATRNIEGTANPPGGGGPTAQFDWSAGTSRDVTFTDTSTADASCSGGISLWSWDFGEPSSPQNTSNVQNPNHTYGTDGTYNVQLTVTDCAGTATVTEAVDVTQGSSSSGSSGSSTPITVTFQNPLGGTGSLTELINRIIDFLFTVAVIVAPILLVVAGVMFMTAAGDTSRVSTARRMLLWTIVGFGIILISKGLVEVLKGILGI